MMQAIVLLRRAGQRFFTLAKKNVVAAGSEAGHLRTAQPAF
jgi:hypothetical protein